ncbi:MAG: gliding motility lipoprotein GldH [Bacteroidetes bacterium]|nr:gliding motility lipoprotein GldH [Bacteroidota bacterium]
MRFKVFASTLLVFAFLVGCDSNLVFEKYAPINGSWLFEEPVSFTVDINQPDDIYALYVNVRNTNDYEWSNLWVKLTTIAPDSSVHNESYNLTLAEPNGQWLGKSWGGTITHEKLVQANFKFAKPGTYQFILHHDMRMNQVKGITHAGIRLEKMEFNSSPEPAR